MSSGRLDERELWTKPDYAAAAAVLAAAGADRADNGLPGELFWDMASNLHHDGWAAAIVYADGRVESISRADFWRMHPDSSD